MSLGGCGDRFLPNNLTLRDSCQANVRGVFHFKPEALPRFTVQPERSSSNISLIIFAKLSVKQPLLRIRYNTVIHLLVYFMFS